MTNYAALVAYWPSAIGATTKDKMDWVNAQTVTGAVPTAFPVTGAQILGCLDFTEFNSLTVDKQANILRLCQMQNLIGGANTFVGKLFASYYAAMLGGPTIAAFVLLAKATTQPWWQANLYPRTFDLGDIAAAGLS